jgi:hypothetical protein
LPKAAGGYDIKDDSVHPGDKTDVKNRHKKLTSKDSNKSKYTPEQWKDLK